VRTASLAAAVAILALAGCGGGSTEPKRHVPLTAFEQRGKALFIPTCGRCHELADAGTSGIAGPPLTEPWAASRVREVIDVGPGMMPDGLFTGAQADEVAAYVAAATK
jgi:mono/diheme cytochrome c family protein